MEIKLLDVIKDKNIGTYSMYILAKNRSYYFGSEELQRWYMQEGVKYTRTEMKFMLYLLGKRYVYAAEVMEYFGWVGDSVATLMNVVKGLISKGVLRCIGDKRKTVNKAYVLDGVGVSAVYISGGNLEVDKEMLSYFNVVEQGSISGYLKFSGREDIPYYKLVSSVHRLESQGLIVREGIREWRLREREKLGASE